MDEQSNEIGEMQHTAMQCNALQSYTSFIFRVSLLFRSHFFLKYRLYVTDPRYLIVYISSFRRTYALGRESTIKIRNSLNYLKIGLGIIQVHDSKD